VRALGAQARALVRFAQSLESGPTARLPFDLAIR
jgi:hypothetical protein